MTGAILFILLGVPSALAIAEFFVPRAPPYRREKAGDTIKRCNSG